MTYFMTLFDLPIELIERILIFLPPLDLLNVNLTSHFFHNVVSNSVLIQYAISLKLADVEDNPQSHFTVLERQNLLEKREDAWFNLTPTAKRIINCDFESGGLYDLVSGIYVLGDATRTSLHYIHLPQSSDPDPEWQIFDAKDGRWIVDFGLGIEEHDLIVTVTSVPHTGDRFLLELSFWQLSTSQPHPLAKKQNIRLFTFMDRPPSANVEIVGDHLVFVTSHNLRHDDPTINDPKHDRVYVFDWKTGKPKMHLEVPQATYSGFVILSEDVFLLPNLKNVTLELWQIASSDDAETEIKSVFDLPGLAGGWQIRHISCRCDPNPLGRNSPKPRSRLPFRSARDDAIILFEVYVLHPTVEMAMYSMFIHRSSILKLLPQPSTDPIPYKDWGPSVVHLLTLPRLSRWITISSGQRFAMLFPISGGENRSRVPIMLFDFNPHTVRRVSQELARDPKFNERPTMPTMMAVISDMEVSNQCPYFESGVSYSLPVAWVMSRTLFDFSEGIVMDEDRILGLHTRSSAGYVTSIEILHFD